MQQDRINALRHLPIADGQLLIGKTWQAAQDARQIDALSPIDGARLCGIAQASALDVDAAVNAARIAFDSGRWSRMAPAERKKVLHRIADRIEGQQAELAVLGVRDNGTEVAMAWRAEPGSAAGTFRYYAECVDKVVGEIASTPEGTLGLVHREPVGVVAAIVPWNFPLMIGAWKIAPALAAGNSVVLKPSEDASLTLLALAQICLDAGLPEGVLNVVTGTGAVTGDALAHHPQVDLITFTGSGTTGRSLLRASADSNLKRVYLELGGKSPNIVFDDVADIDHAAKVSAMGIFRNSGQVCVAGSRLLVQRSIHDALVERICQVAQSLRVGDPLDVRTDIGALSSARQMQRVQTLLQQADAEGVRRVCGGDPITPVPGGMYMRPAVLADVTPQMTIAQQEVFGPVLAVTPFDTEDEAVALANGTVYGLAAGVWTGNLSRAHRMVRRVRAGVVHVNTYGGPDITVPLGGVRQSGNGHDKSMHALDKYLDLKTAWFQL